MFITSLVKEEHHYWYLTSLAWLTYLGFKRTGNGFHWYKILWPVALQTVGQHLNPDGTQSLIATYINDRVFRNNPLLWVLGSITYISAMKTISKSFRLGPLLFRIVSCALCCVALLFKLCSTRHFNPEMLDFAPPWLREHMAKIDTDSAFRIFGTCLVAAIIYSLVQLRVSRRVSTMGKLGYILISRLAC